MSLLILFREFKLKKNFKFKFKEIQSRKERSNMLFDTSQYLASSALMAEDNDFDEENFVCTHFLYSTAIFSNSL
jgi:hypothetical protein